MKKTVCFILILFFLCQPLSGYAAEQSPENIESPNASQEAGKESPERSLFRAGGTINKQVGSALSEYGGQRGGLIGMGARVSGSIYTATGAVIEDVADNKKGVGEAYKDTTKAAVTAIKRETTNKKSDVPKIATKKADSSPAPAKHHTPTVQPIKIGESKVETPEIKPVVAEPQVTAEEKYIAILESSDEVQKRNTLKEIHSSQLIYNRNILDACERILLEKHMEDNDPVFADSLGWMCRILADSGETRYFDTLKKVASNGATWRLRTHAANGRDKLSREAVVNEKSSYGGIEEKLQKLAKLQQNGLITQEEYDAKRKEIIKQL
jgi:hypothetical protein